MFGLVSCDVWPSQRCDGMHARIRRGAMELDRVRAHTFEARNATFPLPHVVRKDMFVKVGARGERFWCKVRSVRDGTLRVIVERDLLWPRRHELVIQHEHV